MQKVREKSTAKYHAALRGIREALARNGPPLRQVFPNLDDAWIQAHVAKRERATFKSFLLTVEHLGNVDLKKAARRVGVSKELLDKWSNTPETSKCINYHLKRGRRRRAGAVVGWAKCNLKMGSLTLKAPLAAFKDKMPPDGIDYGDMRPWAKMAAGVFKYPERFRVFVDTALHFHKSGGMSSAKQFFIDLGKCLSHGTPGARGINPESWDKTDFDLVDIALSYDSPISDNDVVRELENRGHVLRGVLPTLEVRFRKRKHRLILDAYAFLKQSHLKA